MLNGALTGAFYSCTRGLVPTVVGGVTGMATVTALHFLFAYLKEIDLISFDMKY